MAAKKRAKRLVLDWGSSAVRLCELTPTKTGHQLTKYFQREFNIDPAMEEEERQQIKLDTLRDLLKDAKVRARKAIVGVPGQSVFMRPRALPPVPEYKVNQIVRYEILQQIPFSLDQIAYDYQVLNRTEAGGYDVLMAAIKTDVVEKQIDPVMKVRKQIGAVDVCPLAAYNWLKHCGEFGDEGECVALIDLGSSTTDIVIEREGQFRFPRSINFGGDDITRALSSEFNMSFPDAEQLKRERGFAPSGDPQRDGKGGEVIGRVLGRLVAEISRSFAYFRSQPGGGAVARVILTGGGACLRNIVPYMQRELGVDVRIAQPLSGLAIAPEAQEVNDHPEQAAVVLGLGLRACESVPIEIDLIPPRVLESLRRREQAFYYALSLVTFGLILASIIPVSAQKNKEVLRQIDQWRNVINEYERMPPNVEPRQWQPKHSKELSTAKSQLTSAKNQLTALDETLQEQRHWLLYLNAINEARLEAVEELGWPEHFLAIHTMVSAQITPIGGEGGKEYTCETFEGLRQTGGFGSGWGRGGIDDDDDDYDDYDGGSGRRGGRGRAAAQSMGAPGGLSGFGGGASISFGGPGGMMGGPGGGRGRGPGGAQASLPETNGLVIHGYGSDPEVITAFVQALRRRSEWIENGVYFSARDCNRVQPSALDQGAGVTASTTSTMGSFGDMDDDEDGQAGRRRGGGSRFSTGVRPGMGGGVAMGMPAIRTFRVDLQFAGEAAALDAERLVGRAGRATGPMGGAGGRGFAGLGADDDDDDDPRSRYRRRRDED